ncbi:MAG: hypothetical protein GX318_06605 [Clostridia bacterium]|nr:hypothetical protein [Clostridia bacterium]
MAEMEELIQKLVSNLRSKKEYMEELRSYALRQKQGLEKKDIEGLPEIISARSDIAEKIDGLDGENRELLSAISPGVGGGLGLEVEELGRASEELAREIHGMDQESILLARGLEEDLKKDLKNISSHRRSKNAYQGEGKRFTGAFLNEKG